MKDEDSLSTMRRRVLASIGAGLLVTLGFQSAVHAASGEASLLETVATFDDDFRLVGIGVSRKGRVFATAPSSVKRSRYSMVEVDTQDGRANAISGRKLERVQAR